MNLTYILVLVVIVLLAILLVAIIKNKKNEVAASNYIKENIPNMYSFLDKLSAEEKMDFYYRVEQFIRTHEFVGIKTKVELKDKVLVASGLMMMLFRTKVSFVGNIGLVYISNVPMEERRGTLPQSKSSTILKTDKGFDIYINREELNYGFENLEDNKNLLVHQFAHILDGLDGAIDGLPNLFIPPNKIDEWNVLAKKHMASLKLEDTLENRYIQKKRSEFFAMVTEHYFENPKELEQKSPQLYTFLDKIFQGQSFD